MDYHFWVPVIINTIIGSYGIYLQRRQISLMLRSKPSLSIDSRQEFGGLTYWSIGFLVALMLMSWIPFFLTRGNAEKVLRPIILYNPMNDTTMCSAKFDGSQLLKFREKYDLHLVCGLQDPKVDRMRDTRITISQAYTIQPSVMDVAVPNSQPFNEAVSKIQSQMMSKEEQAKKISRPGSNPILVYRILVWESTVLLPKGMDVAEIHQLSDVLTHNGQIID
jgi:hypothetical protein